MFTEVTKGCVLVLRRNLDVEEKRQMKDGKEQGTERGASELCDFVHAVTVGVRLCTCTWLLLFSYACVSLDIQVRSKHCYFAKLEVNLLV